MTDRQLESNRANSQFSTGPRTEEGKRRSRFNAVKHNLYSKVHIATPEEIAAFEAHCAGYRKSLAPVGFEEQELAHAIAEDRWRLKRARAIENSIFARGIHDRSINFETGHTEINEALAEGQIWTEQAKFLTALTQFEQRIQRSIREHTAELKALQEARREAYNQSREEAILLAQLSESKGEIYDPAPDFADPSEHGGFVFHAPSLNRYVDRDMRLREAGNLRNWVPIRSQTLPQAA